MKPANLGSSVGISKAKDRAALIEAMELAGSFDRRIIVEAAVPEAREIECAVLGNDDPEASVPGEVIPSREFYDYEAKYIDSGSQTIIPADLPPALTERIRRLSIEAFQAIDCAGMARVDFLLSRKDDTIYVNEVNTIPGFTTISMYSKMWAASGVSYPELLDRLIALAVERHAAQARAAHQRHMTRPRSAAILLLGVVLFVQAAGDAATAPQLTGVDGLVRVYDAILEARFDDVDAALTRACPPAPREACEVLAATALWWRIQLDPDSRTLDAEFSTAADLAITDAEAWVVRSPNEAEAWFYLGGAYAARVQWRVLRNERLAAARDGKRILTALERAVALDPTLDDAYFAMGMYKSYADVAPRAAKFFRLLLALPGGDKKMGLAQMLRARTRGKLLRGEADYQLHIIYLWYERQTPRAIEILETCAASTRATRCLPARSPAFRTNTSTTPRRVFNRGRRCWRRRANGGSTSRCSPRSSARLAIARLLDTLHETDEAIEHLEAVIALRPKAPFGALGLAHAAPRRSARSAGRP